MTPMRQPLERPPMFRRRRFDASHRRPGLLAAILRPLAMALLIIGPPAVFGLWVLTSPRFELESIHIATGERVAESWVAENLEPLRGRHVLLLSLPEVEGLLAGHRWVQGVEVSKKLPGSLVIQVLERIPVAVLRSGGARHYVDRDGRVIDRIEPGAQPALLLIDAAPADHAAIARAVRAIEALEARGSTLFAKVEAVEVLQRADLKLTIPGLPYAVLVRPDHLEPAVTRFEELQSEIERRFDGFIAVDLRYHRQIVMRFPEA